MTDNNLLNKVLEISSNSKRDCALKQGRRFNKEQSELAPLREGFSNPEKKEITLEMVDKKETSVTDPLRQKFNEKMSQYSRAFNSRISTAIDPGAPPPIDIYGINTAEQIYTKSSQGDQGGWSYPWSGARLKNISATGRTNLWGVNSNNAVFKCPKPCAQDNWTLMPGGITQLSADDSYVYGIAPDDTIWRIAETGEGGWGRLGGALTNITASGKDWVWGVNRNGNVYRCAKPCSGAWIEDDGILKQVSGDKDYVWGVKSGGMIFKKPINGSGSWDWSPSSRGAGMTGSNVNRLIWISASAPNYVWGVGNDRRMWYCRKPCTDGNWQTMGIFGAGTQVEGSNSSAAAAFEAAAENRDAEQSAALQAANAELMDMAAQLWTRTENLGDKATEAQTSLNTEREKLRQQMELLQARSEILQSLETNNKTLDAELTAKRHQHDSAYTQNIIWFAAAVTLTVVAFHKFIGG